ncbi:hypothetical protein C8J57DRAFT_1645450 [Mycena rebaudengoi]|nr:hypothetical protein C8J57DRAFT_1645450 [Mycena rebaudengoi]
MQSSYLLGRIGPSSEDRERSRPNSFAAALFELLLVRQAHGPRFDRHRNLRRAIVALDIQTVDSPTLQLISARLQLISARVLSCPPPTQNCAKYTELRGHITVLEGLHAARLRELGDSDAKGHKLHLRAERAGLKARSSGAQGCCGRAVSRAYEGSAGLGAARLDQGENQQVGSVHSFSSEKCLLRHRRIVGNILPGIEKAQKLAVAASKPRKIDAVAPTSPDSPFSSHIRRFEQRPANAERSNHTHVAGYDQNILHRMASLDASSRGFPQEIIDALVDEMAGDTKTLVACSLTGSHLHHSHSTPAIPSNGSLLLARRACTGVHHIVSSCLTLLPHPLYRFAGAEGEHEQMIRIMHKLQNIEVLTLEYYNSVRGSLLENAILSLLRKSTFKHLHLSTSDLSPSFLASVMMASPALTLGESRVQGQYVSPPSSSRPSALECLILPRRGMGTDQQHFLLHPTTSIFLRSIKRLYLHETAGAELCATLFSLMSSSLERLKLQCSPNALLPLFDFPQLPALRFVKFQISRVAVSRIDSVVAHMRDVAPQVEILVTHY